MTEQTSQHAVEDAGPGPFSLLRDREWQNLVERDDRTSPAEYPDMALISRIELTGSMVEAWLLGRSQADQVSQAAFAEITRLILAALAERKWRPIETAPKDCGVSILIAINVPRDGVRVYQARWSEVAGCFSSLNGFTLFDGAHAWMPLPDGPEQPGLKTLRDRSAESMTDEELVTAHREACKAFDEAADDLDEDGGRAGSPLENHEERIDEIETALRRRGFDPARLPEQPEPKAHFSDLKGAWAGHDVICGDAAETQQPGERGE